MTELKVCKGIVQKICKMTGQKVCKGIVQKICKMTGQKVCKVKRQVHETDKYKNKTMFSVELPQGGLLAL